MSGRTKDSNLLENNIIILQWMRRRIFFHNWRFIHNCLNHSYASLMSPGGGRDVIKERRTIQWPKEKGQKTMICKVLHKKLQIDLYLENLSRSKPQAMLTLCSTSLYSRFCSMRGAEEQRKTFNISWQEIIGNISEQQWWTNKEHDNLGINISI
jgi:hypothetical protein